MDEEFESFVVTNPDLVDEGIDVSGLRTTTDTSPFLLGNIPGGPGIQYSSIDPTRYSDLIRFYSQGLPMLDVPQATQDFTGGQMIDTGGGGGIDQATGGLDLGDTTITGGTNLNDYEGIGNTTMPSNLTSNMVGNIDPTPVDTYTSPTANVAPDGTSLGNTNTGLEDYLDIDYTIPVTTRSGNNALGLQDPQSLAIGPSGAVNLQTGPGIDDLLDDAILTSAQAPVEQASPGIMNPYDPSQNTILGKPGIDRFDEGEAGIDLDPSAGIEDISVELPATNIETNFEPQAVNTIVGPDGITYDAVTGNPIYEDLDAQAAATTLELNQIQDQPLRDKLSSSLTSATEGLSNVADLTGEKLKEIGTSIASSIGGIFKPEGSTITVPGLGEIDVKQTIGGMILNKVVGGPISLVFSAVKALAGMLPEGGRGDVSDALGEKYGMDDIGRLTGGPMEGYSVGPDHAQTVQDRIDSIENRSAPQTDASRQKIAELKDYKSEVIAAGSSGVIIDGGDVLGPGEFLPEGEDLISLEDQLAEQAAAEQAQAAKIEAERRELQEINARAEREAADAQAAANAAAQAAAIEAQRRTLQNINAGGGGNGGGGGGARSGGSSSGGTSSTSSGLGGLGFSDIRLKDNVELIGKSPSNINIYKFNYKGDSTIYQGAMANEVSWASVKADNGYLMIDYDKIDVEFKKYAK